MKEETIKYRGVNKQIRGGKTVFRFQVVNNGVSKSMGWYKTAKECAKAYDLYVIKNNLPQKTNFFKKKLA